MAFEAKVVLITGAASGIGLATAKKLASLDAILALTDINDSALQNALHSCGGGHLGIACDVASSGAVDDFVAQVIKQYGRIDHIFNCAGVNPTDTPLEETSDAYWDKLMGTNLKGIFNVTRACIPHLQNGASFVNVSSILGTRGSAQNAVYCATKYGVIGFSKSLALELGPKGIRTNVVAPGFIDTPTNNSVVAGKEAVERAAQSVAMKRLGAAEEVADVVIFLFSDASRYMNGSVVEINGGT